MSIIIPNENAKEHIFVSFNGSRYLPTIKLVGVIHMVHNNQHQ